jgi:hypothetical protein
VPTSGPTRRNPGFTHRSRQHSLRHRIATGSNCVARLVMVCDGWHSATRSIQQAGRRGLSEPIELMRRRPIDWKRSSLRRLSAEKFTKRSVASRVSLGPIVSLTNSAKMTPHWHGRAWRSSIRVAWRSPTKVCLCLWRQRRAHGLVTSAHHIDYRHHSNTSLNIICYLEGNKVYSTLQQYTINYNIIHII